MHLLNGTALAASLRDTLLRELQTLPTTPTLGVLLVGEDPASVLYVALKERAAADVGIRTHVLRLPAETPDEILVQHIQRWNDDPSVHAILVQLPLPEGHDEDRVIRAIDPRKDVDGFHPTNREALLRGDAAIIPPVHEGILRLIAEAPIRLNGARVTVLANSTIFADPLAHLLKKAGATVRVMPPDAIERPWLATSDIVITALGRLAFLNPSMTKRDAVIIDVGTNKTADGKVRGDVDLDSYGDRPVWVTPVPGGVGPMTVAMLLKNVVMLARQATR